MKNKEIQYLRSFGMLLILLGHMPIVLPNVLLHGYTFVSLFLAISGYFTMLQFEKRYIESSYSRIKIFSIEIINKYFRIIPLVAIWILIYYVIGHVCMMIGWQYGDEYRWYHELKSAILLYYNYYLAGLDIGGLFGQFWTIFVEIHLSVLILALLVIFKSRKSHILLCAAAVLLTIAFGRPFTPVKLIRYATLAQADSYFAGAFIAAAFRGSEKKYLAKYHFSRGTKLIISSLLIFILFISGDIFDNYLNIPNLKYTFYTLVSGIILFLARENDGWFDYPGFAGSLLGWVGDISASVYLSHVILYSCIYWNIYANTNLIPEFIKTTTAGIVIQVVFLIFAACIVGQLSLFFIERPYAEYGKKLVRFLQETEDNWRCCRQICFFRTDKYK